MTQTCEKCGIEYVTGQDDIDSEDNEYSTTKVSLYIEQTGGYKTTKTVDKYIEENDLCIKCASTLWEILSKVHQEFMWGKE